MFKGRRFPAAKILVAAWLACGGCAAAQIAMPDPCAAGAGDQPAQVLAVNERLELVQGDGGLVLLAGIEVPAGAMAPARVWLDAQMLGPEATLRKTGTTLDRWGRGAALVFAGPGPSVQERMIALGLARVRVPWHHPCRAAFLAAERQARDAGLGLWLAPETGVLQATLPDSFDGLEGQVVVVEGVVAGVTGQGFRTWLNFGPVRYRDFSVTILKPDVKIFEKNGLSPPALAGHRVRVRGVLDMRFGPQIEIADPQAVEVMDTEGRRP